MQIVLVGPGRAGHSLGRRFRAAGHTVIGVLSRQPERARAVAADLDAVAISWDGPLPRCDLLVVAVRDDAIATVAARLAPHAGDVEGVVHLSGLTPVGSLGPLAERIPAGSFHPLQTLPDPDAGAQRLEGAWVAVTSPNAVFADQLFGMARTLGMHPFEIDDECKAVYHAAASAAANYPLAALAMAQHLFGVAGVPWDAAEPLVRAMVDNAFDLGPVAALTGPVARGDRATVEAQLTAVADCAPDLTADFRAMGRATARLAGTDRHLGDLLT